MHESMYTARECIYRGVCGAKANEGGTARVGTWFIISLRLSAVSAEVTRSSDRACERTGGQPWQCSQYGTSALGAVRLTSESVRGAYRHSPAR